MKNLISLGEGFTIEFKRSGKAELGRELCAFANGSGGAVLLGVDDNGTICGVANHNKLKSEIQSLIRAFEPPLKADIESVDDVLVITVPPQNGKPYSFGGKFFLRDGASSQQLRRNEIREFFFREGVIRYDETVCEWYDVEKELTGKQWRVFADRAGIPGTIKSIPALENLHLMRKGKM
ncbi:MAG: putative DNA binding domain-containing protein, partial [Fibrobacteria bacterium]|nr:putative DNA binding domain-containing protein [Fibrobacteria bacterium]